MMEATLALLFGLLIGSFLNVCIYRWPLDLSVVQPRSHCTGCEKTIAWYDNVPVLSFFALRGRCRHCHEKISWRYPVVELSVALFWFYWVYSYGATLLAAKMCIFTALCIGLVFTDLEELILPDEMTIGGTIMGLVFAWFVPVADYMASLLQAFGFPLPTRYLSLVESALGAGLPALFLFGGGWLYEKIRHREGLGFGDVKLIAMVGAFLGLRAALFTLILGSLSGSVIGYAYIKAKGEDPSTYELPFGSFLGVSAIVIALMGPLTP